MLSSNTLRVQISNFCPSPELTSLLVMRCLSLHQVAPKYITGFDAETGETIFIYCPSDEDKNGKSYLFCKCWILSRKSCMAGSCCKRGPQQQPYQAFGLCRNLSKPHGWLHTRMTCKKCGRLVAPAAYRLKQRFLRKMIVCTGLRRIAKCTLKGKDFWVTQISSAPVRSSFALSSDGSTPYLTDDAGNVVLWTVAVPPTRSFTLKATDVPSAPPSTVPTMVTLPPTVPTMVTLPPTITPSNTASECPSTSPSGTVTLAPATAPITGLLPK
jgi:hypothetical protein